MRAINVISGHDQCYYCYLRTYCVLYTLFKDRMCFINVNLGHDECY